MRIRAVVVNFNAGGWLDRCLQALEATDWEPPLEIVVVDNASTDDSLQCLDGRPDVRLVKAPSNLGFGRANNLALADLAGIDAVALVNPDAEVTAGWLAPLVDALERDPRVGAACPKILFAGRDVVNNAGTFVSPSGNAVSRGFLERDEGQYDEPGEVPVWTATAVLLRADYLCDVGLFDERLFLYYEDVDLALRGAKRGWRYQYVPASVARHGHAQMTIEGSDLFVEENAKSRLVVAMAHGHPVPAWLRFAAGLVRLGGTEVLQGRFDLPATRARSRGAAAAVRLGRKGPSIPYPRR